MPSSPVLPIEWLHGRKAAAWSGVEMALGGGATDLETSAPEDGKWDTTPPIWRVAEVPFAQFVQIDIDLSDGSVVQLASQLDDGSGFHGLYLLLLGNTGIKHRASEPGSIYRVVSLPTVPIGELAVSVLRRDDSNAVIEAEIAVGATKLRLISAEVYERDDGSFEIREVDESVLLQVEGASPAVQAA